VIKRRLLSSVAFAAVFIFVAGCASGPEAGKRSDLLSTSEQNDNQKRARIRMQLAIGYYEQRQMPVALDEIKQALLADPDLADAYSMRGLIYMEMGEHRLAEENFLTALRLAPTSPDFNNNYGWFLCQNGRERQSLQYFDLAVRNQAYQSPAKALNNAGVCSIKLKDRAGAERYFLQAFQYDPGSASVNINLGKIYFDRGEYARARFYVGRVMKDEVMTAEVLWLAIRIERKSGDRTAENSLATQLRRRHPGSAEYAAYQRGAFDE